jgi:3-deoxy-manno-octulosonate cytidylyltransferase (CMP-KDO synthetase)
MRTLAVIPARLGATRLPRKPLRLLAGKPLIVRVFERVTDLNLFDRVVVATDSDEIETAVANHAGRGFVVQTGEHNSGTERIRAAVYDNFLGDDYDVVVNVQGDEPFISKQALLGATRMVTDARYQIGTAAVLAPAAVLADPNVVKVVTDYHGRAMYFSRAPIPYLRDPSDAEVQRAEIYQHIGVYAYAIDTLLHWPMIAESPLEQIERLEQLRALAAGIPIGVSKIDEPVRPGIDTEEDLDRANRDWAAFTSG